MGHFAGDEVGRALAVACVLGTHVLRNGGQGRHKGVIIGVFLGDLRVARQTGRHDDQGVVGGSIQVHAHLVVGARDNGLEGFFQQSGGDGRVGGVERQHGGHVGGDHAAALADGTHGAGLAAQLELDGVLLFVGVGGHDGRCRVGAALLGSGQPGGCRRDAPGKRVNDHGLADDARGGGQNILGRQIQCLAHQLTALLGQGHAVGGAGIGVAAVDEDGLCIAVFQVGAVHLDGSAADLIGGVNARCRAARPDAAADACGCKTLGRADAARYFLVTHFLSPYFRNITLIRPLHPDPASGSCTGWQRRKNLCPGYRTGRPASSGRPPR